ncbi:MAG: hypothetical protein QM640_01605 [Niabella sp.]
MDGKMSDGTWRPLTTKELDLKTDYGRFEGNDLVLPDNTTVSRVSVTATLKSNTKNKKQVIIWIKQEPDPPLPAYDADAEIRSRKRSKL